MPKRRRAKQNPRIAAYAKVDSYDVRTSFGFNIFLVGRIRDDLSGDAEVFDSATQLLIRGNYIEPKDRLGERIELTVYSRRSDRETLRVKDVHSREKNVSRIYRMYRGDRVPVLDLPHGVTTICHRRADRLWTSSIFVEPRLVTDMLTQLMSPHRTLFISFYEVKAERERWLTSLSLQTIDPAVEN
jgi:hypothetical protein